MNPNFQLITKENNIYDLAYNYHCLQTKDNCPLKEIDHLLFKRNVSWIQSLSE